MALKEQIVDLTKKLASIKSTADRPKELARVAETVEKFLANEKLVKQKFIKNNKVALVYTFKKTKQPKIFMIGHLDVVPAEDTEFNIQVKGDRLIGRGVEDMKGSDVVMILLMQALSKIKNPPSVGLMLTTDEEVGGFNGVGYLINEKGYDCDVAFVPDAGENFDLTYAQKGIVHLKITAKGKSAHGSRPWLGDNALDKLVDACHYLREEFPPVKKAVWTTTCNLGKITGGTVANVVPDQAEMLVDIRFTEKHNQSQLIKKISQKLSDLKVEKISGGEVVYTQPNNPYFKSFKKLTEKELARKARTFRSHGASDGRFLAAKNIPVILTGCVGGNTHGRGEWVSINSLLKLYSIVKNFVLTEGFKDKE